MQVFVFKFPASYDFCVNISLKQHQVLGSYSDIYEFVVVVVVVVGELDVRTSVVKMIVN